MIKAHKLYICICLMWHKYTSGKFSSLPLSFSSTSRQGNKKKKKKKKQHYTHEGINCF